MLWLVNDEVFFHNASTCHERKDEKYYIFILDSSLCGGSRYFLYKILRAHLRFPKRSDRIWPIAKPDFSEGSQLFPPFTHPVGPLIFLKIKLGK